MNTNKLNAFVALLKEQSIGSESAIERIQDLNVVLSDGYCLFNLYEQWKQAFSFYPGQKKALPHILSLSNKILEVKADDTSVLYKTNEWKELVALRGPAECILVRSCKKCSGQYIDIGTSGFYDAKGLVCSKCGNAFFKSYYDDSATPHCDCGSEFPEILNQGCPSCGEKEYSSVRSESPYEYFYSHSYQRGKGA
ncbi:MAG: hypothetical protein AAGC78_03250 [Cellvibrio sp.]|uniref:hypothetical protein n=1 Tax=Cellvibrio sp. TaxID=1965322 RepID=UPI0031AEC766